MLRRIAIIGVVAWAGPAFAQQDPEVEREASELERVDVTEDADDAPIELRWEPGLAARVRAGAGAVGGGDTINPGSGPMSIVDGAATGRLTRGRLSFEAPLEYSHRQTYVTSLTEMRGRGGGRLIYRFTPRVRAAAELALGATWKPDWQDPFQPLDGGGFGKTDRYSHWDRHAAAEVVVRPALHQRVRVGYEYVLSVYQHDPMFDPIYDPIHLTPWDRDVHRVDAAWQLREGRWKFLAGAEASLWHYFFMFAGDSKTGVTHAGPGGEPPNPLLELRELKPRVGTDVALNESVVVRARYELELMQDTFKGYLSYVGHHPELMVAWALPRDAEVGAGVELFLRRYGRHSYDYEMDPMHPPLAWGDRRSERLLYLTVEARMPLAPHWAAVAEAKLASRRTNYAYSIDWDYFNWLAWTGAEYRY